MTSLSPSRPGWGGPAVGCRASWGCGLCQPLSWGGRLWGLGGQESLAGGLRALLRVHVCECVVVVVGFVHARLCPCLGVRVSLSVCQSLHQMLSPLLADHLTPPQPWIPPCVSGAGPRGRSGRRRRVGWRERPWMGEADERECKGHKEDGGGRLMGLGMEVGDGAADLWTGVGEGGWGEEMGGERTGREDRERGDGSQ